jgi:hypothetical protein
MITSQSLGKWLKDHPRGSQAHRVRRYDRDTLVCYCGLVIKAVDAIAPLQSVACCLECTSRWREQLADKLKQKREEKGKTRNEGTRTGKGYKTH